MADQGLKIFGLKATEYLSQLKELKLMFNW